MSSSWATRWPWRSSCSGSASATESFRADASARRRLSERTLQAFLHGLNLRAGHLGIERKGEDLPRRFLGTREAAGAEAEVGVGPLEMDRDRVMDPRADAGFLQPAQHVIAPG